MGLVETIVEHVSIKTVLLGPLVLLTVYHVFLYVSETIRVRRLGVPGYQIKTRVPFGLDVILADMKAAKAEKSYERWLEVSPPEKGIFTSEARLLCRRVVFTSEPENIKAVLATQFADYGKGEIFHEQWKPFLGDSIFATDGDKWHASRQLIRPQFVKDRVSDLHCFEKHIQVLFRAMANGGPLNGAEQDVDLSASHGKVFEISDLLFRYTLDTSTDFLLGHTVSSLCHPKQEFAEAFNEVQRVQNIISRIGPLGPFISHKTYNAGLKVINRFVNNFIDAALLLPPEELATKARSDTSYTFLHELASFTRDPVVLRDQIVAVLLAGRDTTAGTLSWAFYELGGRPDVVARLRAEVLSVVGPDRVPTYADLKGMKYLQSVLSETMRLYPAVPYNVRFAARDTTLPRGGGPDGTLPLPVLKDTAVAYSTFVMQRRPDLYPAPDASRGLPPAGVFEPERWQRWQPRPWQYVPFNGGPRICVGQQFAQTIMAYLLVRVFQRFDRVETVRDRGEPTLRTDVTLSPGGPGVRVRFFEAKRE